MQNVVMIPCFCHIANSYPSPKSAKNSEAGSTPETISFFPRTSAGDIEQVAFGVIDFVQFYFVGNRIDAVLIGQDLIIASHDDDLTEFEAFG